MEEKSDSIKEDTPEILRKFDEITNRVKYQDYIMPYGKHQGRFLCEILTRDPDYFYWAAQHVKGDLQKAFEWHISEEVRNAVPERRNDKKHISKNRKTVSKKRRVAHKNNRRRT